MTNLCPIDRCARPAHEGWTICDQHSWELERNLGDIPALAAELDITLSRQTASGQRNGARSSEKPLAFDYGASEAAFVLRNALVGWVRDLEPDPGPGHDWPADTLDAMARWLLGRIDELRTHPAAEEVVGEISAAVRECTRAIDRRAGRVYAGRCLASRPEGECQVELYARPDKATIKCSGCGATYTLAERRAAMVAWAADRLCTIREIVWLAAMSGQYPETKRTENRLNKWVERGVISPVGVNIHGRETYRFSDVMDALTKADTRKANPA